MGSQRKISFAQFCAIIGLVSLTWSSVSGVEPAKNFDATRPRPPQLTDKNTRRRNRLILEHIVGNGVNDQRVIDAMRSTPRHEFVPQEVRRAAYQDTALPIGFGQTISSPYIVARMTESLTPQPTDRVLEIGTGSGYQAAILSPLVKSVFTIEIVPELGKRATDTLKQLGYKNVQVRVGDGYQGWPEYAPFDKIIVTCSPEDIPNALVEQLAEGGHLVIPVGERYQQTLYRFTKSGGKLKKQPIESTFFVPMTGVAESKRSKLTDDANPQIVNGGFEEKTVKGDPAGWYYVRNGEVVDDPKSPQGIRCLRLTRQSTERAIALQPVGVDGSKVKSMHIAFSSKVEGIRKDLFALQSSQVIVEFYDENRDLCGEDAIDVPAGSFDWQVTNETIDVPREATLAMIELGLFGVTGSIQFDDVQLRANRRDDGKQ